ncbi:dolichyl-phosphate beta-D-mannosyltransferase [Wenyingzhuangia fucanilytica]|uniref:Dolichyl-phosphate beta-D-mannosyltransferase n=1 Tax=Wenyingzhuangia fucanilytica TaxID=1790137 RepID=A0A1B1Y3L5_9FLAO|nr:polyprenol monophosphomannose synthase [Wenyingzhuangia fucanilytica]ANW95337.1 dolichyl-phosphate beta-D-mannosyltransferase [Wenyingzhuangia fucanilytica]
MNRALIIIPTLNEVENINAIIKAVFNVNADYHILIVDDNSTDGTIDIIKNLQKVHPNLYLEIRVNSRGLGKAYIHGFKWAINKDYDYILEMDADFSHNPKDLPRLIQACEQDGNDLAIGSRYINNKINVINWDFKRLMLSYFASKYVKFVTGIPVFDTTAGFICYRRKVLKTIDFSKIRFTGYAFQIEMKFKAWLHKFKIKEVSIIFTDRTKGTSKLDSSIISEAIFGVIRMKFKGLTKK